MNLPKPASRRDKEAGQTSGEYITVTAVAILIAVTVAYTVFSGSLSDAATAVGEGLVSWVTSVF